MTHHKYTVRHFRTILGHKSWMGFLNSDHRQNISIYVVIIFGSISERSDSCWVGCNENACETTELASFSFDSSVRV